MDLERGHYQLLIEVQRRGSITAAADAMFVTQSAASQRLKEAERRVGYALTVRHGRSVHLTAAAQRLVDGGLEAERSLAKAESEARWLGRGQRRSLRLGLSSYDTTDWLTAFLASHQFRDLACGIRIVRCRANDEADSLADDLIDAYMTPRPYKSVTSSTTHHLFDDDLVAVVAEHHELARRSDIRPADIAPFDYATYSVLPTEGFEQEQYFRPADLFPSQVTVMESTSAILAAVRTGHYVTILSRWACPASRGLVVLPLEPSPDPVSWSMMTRDGVESDERGEVLDCLIEHFRQTLSP